MDQVTDFNLPLEDLDLARFQKATSSKEKYAIVGE